METRSKLNLRQYPRSKYLDFPECILQAWRYTLQNGSQLFQRQTLLTSRDCPKN